MQFSSPLSFSLGVAELFMSKASPSKDVGQKSIFLSGNCQLHLNIQVELNNKKKELRNKKNCFPSKNANIPLQTVLQIPIL